MKSGQNNKYDITKTCAGLIASVGLDVGKQKTYQTFWIGLSTVLFCSQCNAEIQRLISILASSVKCNRLHHQKRPIWLALVAQLD